MRKFIIGLIVIAAIAGGAYAIFHDSSDNATTPASSNNSSTQGSTASSTKIVQTKTDSSLGPYLADSKDKPLYTYGGDTTGVSNCSGTCLDFWPIYRVTSSSASLPASVTIIQRSDGQSQYAYKGLPLYYFSNDNTTPTGDGADNFHVAKP